MPSSLPPTPLPREAAPAQPSVGGVSRRRRRQGGFTVIEATVAGAIITLFLGSLFTLNSNMVHMLRAASEAANASQELQTSIEKVRQANWNVITDPQRLAGVLFSTRTDAQLNLPGMIETVTVTAFASPTASATNGQATGSSPGSFTITLQNAASTTDQKNFGGSSALQQQEMIRVDVSVTWPSTYRTRTRSLTTLVSRWGISK